MITAKDHKDCPFGQSLWSFSGRFKNIGEQLRYTELAMNASHCLVRWLAQVFHLHWLMHTAGSDFISFGVLCILIGFTVQAAP